MANLTIRLSVKLLHSRWNWAWSGRSSCRVLALFISRSSFCLCLAHLKRFLWFEKERVTPTVDEIKLLPWVRCPWTRSCLFINESEERWAPVFRALCRTLAAVLLLAHNKLCKSAVCAHNYTHNDQQENYCSREHQKFQFPKHDLVEVRSIPGQSCCANKRL